MTAARVSLPKVIDQLERFHGKPPRAFPTDPFQQILWENVAYLADDAERATAFKTLKREVGLAPEQVLHASVASLRKATSHGILADQFAAKLRECARIALDEFDGNLKALVARPLPQAKRGLRRFPGIGEPGAEKILLFAGREALLAPDSNALRVLRRLGLVPASGSYAAGYTAARKVTSEALPADTGGMQRARQLLRRHGKEVCRTSAPLCHACPLATTCPRIGVTR